MISLHTATDYIGAPRFRFGHSFFFQMPQHEYMELWRKRFGKRFNEEDLELKKQAKEGKRISKQAKTLRGIKAKIFNK